MNTLETVWLCLVVGYGIILGGKNLGLRFVTMFRSNCAYTQSTFGKLLDCVFVASIIYYTVFVFKQFG